MCIVSNGIPWNVRKYNLLLSYEKTLAGQMAAFLVFRAAFKRGMKARSIEVFSDSRHLKTMILIICTKFRG
jgi:hypothetical protein